jgi:hypothetical protein
MISDTVLRIWGVLLTMSRVNYFQLGFEEYLVNAWVAAERYLRFS